MRDFRKIRAWQKARRASDAEFLRYLEMSHASARELSYLLMKAEIAALVTPGEFDDFSARADEVRRILYALMRESADEPGREKLAAGQPAGGRTLRTDR